MPFPNIHTYPKSHPGPYERNMGDVIVKLLHFFQPHVPDTKSAAQVTELAATPDRWSAAHAVFDEIRTRLLAGPHDTPDVRTAQYSFEELCCKAMYNATDAQDPFDSSSPFFIAGATLHLARELDLPIEAVAAIFTSRL